MNKRLILCIVVYVFACWQVRPIAAQWVQTKGPYGAAIQGFAEIGGTLFAGADRDFGGVFFSTNDGRSWTATNYGLANLRVLAIGPLGVNLFVGTYGGGVFLSTNNGMSWTSDNDGLGNLNVFALAVMRTDLFAGTSRGVFLSSNNGRNWTEVDSGLARLPVYALGVMGTNLFAGTWGGGIYLSTNGGRSWTPANLGLRNLNITALRVQSGNVFVGAYGGDVSLSTDRGRSWSSLDLGLVHGASVRAFAVSGRNIFAGTDGAGILVSTDSGRNWRAVNTGMGNRDVLALYAAGTHLLAGTVGSSIWRRPLSDCDIAVSRPSPCGQNQDGTVQAAIAPSGASYELSQNFPNPFNPVMTIRYRVPAASHVTLRVFNSLGQEVTTLVDEEQGPGCKVVEFDGRNVASGTYFYLLRSENFMATRKCVMIK